MHALVSGHIVWFVSRSLKMQPIRYLKKISLSQDAGRGLYDPPTLHNIYNKFTSYLQQIYNSIWEYIPEADSSEVIHIFGRQLRWVVGSLRNTSNGSPYLIEACNWVRSQISITARRVRWIRMNVLHSLMMINLWFQKHHLFQSNEIGHPHSHYLRIL